MRLTCQLRSRDEFARDRFTNYAVHVPFSFDRMTLCWDGVDLGPIMRRRIFFPANRLLLFSLTKHHSVTLDVFCDDDFSAGSLFVLLISKSFGEILR
jgi:hypothetical protein